MPGARFELEARNSGASAIKFALEVRTGEMPGARFELANPCGNRS